LPRPGHTRRGVPGARREGLWRLFRPPLALLVGLSAAAAHALAAGGPTAGALVPGAACLLLAAGASAVNQAQERETDARMARTRHRPLPAGSLAPAGALALGGGAILSGLGLLIALAGPPAAGAGALAVAWYNGPYTWLKRRSSFATVPGALSGSLAPAVGWLAAGGDPSAPGLRLLMLILFLWQAPHFWLLALRHGGDYERAGLPSALRALGGPSLRRVTFVWILATIVATLWMPLCGLMRSRGLFLGLVALAVVLGLLSAPLLRSAAPSDRWLRASLTRLNVYLLAALALAVIDGGAGP